MISRPGRLQHPQSRRTGQLRHWRIYVIGVFTRQIKELVDDDDYRALQTCLVANPDAGDLIPRSGGLRKIRLGVAGRGKRGGARVVYYWVTARSQIYMAKNVQEDLTEDQLRIMRALVKQEFD